MAKANAEQLLAIEHTGGVLLKAGAGSGKTFVLVEHILYLTRNWIKESNNSGASFEEFIREKFSQVVMMTFTKKAAGEMNIRLSDKFLGLSLLENDEQKFWKIAYDALPILTVTTIDGFCRRLITAGYFPHLSTEAKIIFDAERLDQVKILFDEWFTGSRSKLEQDFLEIIIREKKPLLNAMSSIFSDPGLRLAWKSFSVSETHPKKLSPVIKKSFDLNNLSQSLHKIQLLDLPEETSRSTFEKLVATFQNTGLPVVDSVENFAIYATIMETITRLAPETGKKKTELHATAKDGIDELRKWIKAWSPLLKDYQQHYDTKVLPWTKLCLSIFQYIDAHLDPNQGMTFGDIEYEVARGLERKDIRERVQKVYSYFIVDEFQDTSALQFKIITELIGNDFKKLFCVGDPKQAIYGFRGGELSVFQDASEMVPKVLTLANNYRSLPAVITFNNSLFRAVLPSGQDFTGNDPFSVSPEDQNIPAEVTHEKTGQVEILTRHLSLDEDGEKYSTDEINALEAQAIAVSISEKRSEFPDETCTILYRKLRPSLDLVRELIDRHIGFTAQYKIDLLDDPITGIFLLLLKRRFDSELKTRDFYPLFMIQRYLEILRIPFTLTPDDLHSFDHEVTFWGLTEAFKKFIFRLNCTNENGDINLNVIETLGRLYHQDPEDILIQLEKGENQKAGLDFRFGKHSEKVQIMTAHASKGLEFDSVYIGGIYTNGRENADREMFGDHPGSFYWYLDLATREKQKSPFYHFESELNKYKNFSESKRLFYVAATRAKKNLLWVDFPEISDCFSVPKNSWVDGVHFWQNSTFAAECISELKQNELPEIESSSKQTVKDLPLFFYDPVGVWSKDGGVTSLGIMAELSVTRLNSLVDCPRKFYLENILKLDSTVVPIHQARREESDEVQVISSSERGTLIHAQIAHGIEHNFVVPREVFDGEFHAPIEWALNQLRPLNDIYEFIAEKPLKFKFFNFMISGIPDLYLLPKDPVHPAQIWDFKTGKITQTALSHYWIQLKVYSYALYHLGLIPREKSIELKLCFVDQKKFLDLSITFDTIHSELFDLWKVQNEPWRVNLDHCSQCVYGDICPR
jgi:ATP-dependent helicase/nuclease subunit A